MVDDSLFIIPAACSAVSETILFNIHALCGVLLPFQEFFTHIEPIVKQMLAKSKILGPSRPSASRNWHHDLSHGSVHIQIKISTLSYKVTQSCEYYVLDVLKLTAMISAIDFFHVRIWASPHALSEDVLDPLAE